MDFRKRRNGHPNFGPLLVTLPRCDWVPPLWTCRSRQWMWRYWRRGWQRGRGSWGGFRHVAAGIQDTWSSTHAMGDMLQQECKTRWTSTHAMSDSLMTMSQFPRLTRMVRQYLAVLARFASPERLFSSVRLVKSDLWGRLLDTSLIDVMWSKQVP